MMQIVCKKAKLTGNAKCTEPHFETTVVFKAGLDCYVLSINENDGIATVLIYHLADNLAVLTTIHESFLDISEDEQDIDAPDLISTLVSFVKINRKETGQQSRPIKITV
jgi:hypothetical protein